jgi:hypothetical protein
MATARGQDVEHAIDGPSSAAQPRRIAAQVMCRSLWLSEADYIDGASRCAVRVDKQAVEPSFAGVMTSKERC